MLWLRMCLTAWRVAWPDVLTPWRSPLLRWRIATYGMVDEHGRLLHAADVTPTRFFQFLFRNGRALLRFLRWAASL